MYGLKQAALLAYQHLVNQLAPHGYHPCPYTTGLWEHDTRPTKFCLCVDDFGVKYFSTADADHLLNSLRQHYKISVDWAGTPPTTEDFLSSGITRKNMLTSRCLDTLHPLGNVSLQHPKPARPQHAPHQWTQPAYGRNYNWHPLMGPPNSEKLEFTLFNHVLGLFSTMHVLSMQQCSQLSTKSAVPKPRSSTQKTKNACTMLLDYAATYPLAIIRYYASDMTLNVDTDAAYLVLPNARSWLLCRSLYLEQYSSTAAGNS
jgi:hypothetical protein